MLPSLKSTPIQSLTSSYCYKIGLAACGGTLSNQIFVPAFPGSYQFKDPLCVRVCVGPLVAE